MVHSAAPDPEPCNIYSFEIDIYGDQRIEE